MALQKKNALLRAHLIVTLFWFVVLFVATQGFKLDLLAGSLTYAFLVTTGGIASGAALWVAIDMSRRNGVLSQGGEHHLRGANSTIGPVPVAQAPARGKLARSVLQRKAADAMLARRFPWWAKYRSRHPEHAEAFRAILFVMDSVPLLPASPIPGGHGGATLIEHSFNVVDTLMQMAPSWVYRGHKNRKGEISFPLLDTTRAEFRFVADDPILPLTAFAHDIGKLSCYQMAGDGSVLEVRKNHDVEGARILRALPEVMSLSWKDKVALLTACEFYHHLGSIPYSTWIDDRARALIELLIASDIATGQREGGVVVGEYEDADLVAPQPEREGGKEEDDASGQPSGDAAYDPQGVSGRHEPATSDALGSPLDIAYSILLEPGRVNGANASTRIAWKHGDWLYISDAKLRGAVASKTGDSGYNSLPHRGNMHAFTLGLMAQLAADGNLLQEHNGRKFSEKRSIYTTRSIVPGKTSLEGRFVIVARTRAFPGLENAADCKTAPEIVGCSWGETAAVDKAVDRLESAGTRLAKDVADVLLEAASTMALPYVEKEIDGKVYFLFEEEILKQEYPDASFDGDRLIRRTGGASGKVFIGVVATKESVGG